MSILFSKICQFLTFYLVKSSPKNPRWKLERRRSICAGFVLHTMQFCFVLKLGNLCVEYGKKYNAKLSILGPGRPLALSEPEPTQPFDLSLSEPTYLIHRPDLFDLWES